MIKKMFIAVLTIGLLASSCSNDDDNAPSTANLSLELDGLEALGDDFVYEGWIIVDGDPVSTGTFTSVTFPQSFTVDATQLENATTFVLSIEPAGETGTAAATPADTKILVGDFSGDRASVSTAIVGDFTDSWGLAFLRTPTDEVAGSANNGNDENGIWFGTPQMTGAPTAGLGLPVLPAGWKYEGWVVNSVGPLTTGTFTSFTTVDDSNDFSGTENNAGPPVPGEDFFNNEPAGFTFPLDVRGLTAVISVEPDPDNSLAPFTLKPLVGVIGQDVAPATHDLEYSSASFPSGFAIR
ncbi:anti-sigma factor [Flavivirga jejuensis]|uniref:Anti-sigma factor n=2 Tax=Flavivirga jejuensis TaxID=870487 RepID=A0ABT8WTC7_9FLAO|nr:anti-sigma factor [Flavivirga jejuensis]MDO5976410.1 anti-sigma factor [Flavivirga jejuensis]